MINVIHWCFLLFLTLCMPAQFVSAQIDNNGCVGGNFGIDAGLYSGTIEFGDGTPSTGTNDWFLGSSGLGVIDESQTASLTTLLMGGGNPLYEMRMNTGLSSIIDGQIRIDALYARDYFGGTGFMDLSTFETASKNGEDPAIWDAGQANVLGKNDVIDVAGHMFRDGTGLTDNLWFVGLINRAEPGGSAYMDFEFYVEDVEFNSAAIPSDLGEGNFDSGGPDLGHTAFTFYSNGDGTHSIGSVGDFIFNTSLVNGGVDADVELRLWVSYDDYLNTNPVTFNWGSEFDGAFNGSPYGYANVVPLTTDACGIVNLENENPLAPPWGTLNTKTNTYGTSYIDYSVVEVGINMTAFGLDHASLAGTDPCEFPINTFMVKTRASASFTAQLKDFAGPYQWGEPNNESEITGNPLISCDNPEVTLTATPIRLDMMYNWTTVDGLITSDPNQPTITVGLPGTYVLHSFLPTGCPIPDVEVEVGFDPTKPFFNEPMATTQVACNGNDGSIDLTVTGATPPYSYEWYNASDPNTVISTVEDPGNLVPGDYFVIVTDQIPCNITSQNFTVAPENPPGLSDITTNVDCFGDNTGAIDLQVSGGNGPFTYSWSNGAITQDLTDLPAGSYTVTTTDADGCEESLSITVTEPTDFSLSVSTTDVTTPLGNDGTIDLTVSGATPSYTYLWTTTDGSGLVPTDEDQFMLTAGTYDVLVTDANGCTQTISATIYEPEICDDGVDNDGDGLTDCLDDDCIPPSPGVITASDNPVCVGDTGITYSITDVGADSYTWTVPGGAVIINGQGTATITVDWVANEGGQICVVSTSTAGCESTLESCFDVDLHDVPPIPGTINLQGN